MQINKIISKSNAPLKMVLLIIAAVFVAEMQVMLFLFFVDFSPLVEILIDVFMLTAMLVPVVYLLIYNPMAEHIAELRETKQLTSQQAVELTAVNRKLRQEIEDRVKIQQDLVKAKEASEKANRSKSDFLANMSHEIRTPLNGVIGITELALLQELPPNMDEYLHIIKSSGDTLLRLINDILDLSKIEAGKLELEKVKFNLPDLLDNISLMLGEHAAQKNLDLIFDYMAEIPKQLIGDPLRIEQVLVNLVSNAIKFTESGGIYVKVTAHKLEKERVEIRFAVRDSGVGISPEQVAEIFQAFQQADGSITRKYGGTGLGLTISKSLAENMNGTIWVENSADQMDCGCKVDHGSTFIFTAELEMTRDDTENKLILPRELQQKHVLVIDDSCEFCRIMAKILTYFGLRVTTALSAQEGIAILKQSAGPDAIELIFLDLIMPETNGLEAAKIIKDDPVLKNIEILMVTAFGRIREKQQAEEIGIHAFISKPVRLPSLFDAILEAFGKKDQIIRAKDKTTSLKIAATSIRGKKIMVVDDQYINQRVAQEILNSAGAEVVLCSGGHEAVAKIKSDKYDAVILDVQMPKLDGYQVCKMIRENIGKKELPIIAATANAMKGDREKCLAAGMNDYISKPIEPEKFITTLAKWLPDSAIAGAPGVEAKTIPKEVQIDLPDLLPDVDAVEGCRRLMGNKELFMEMLTALDTEYCNHVDQIKQLWLAGEKEEAWKTAHALKGAAGNVGVVKVHEVAGELEEMIKTGETDNIDQQLHLLADAFASFQKRIK